MTQTAFFSGEYRKWTYAKQVGVPFYMRSMRVPHLNKALGNGKIKSITVEVNGTVMDGCYNEGDRLHFKKMLFRGNYSVLFEITYVDLEPPKYESF